LAALGATMLREKERTMTKQEASWLVIRIVGVYFLIQAVLDVTNMLSYLGFGYKIFSTTSDTTDTLAGMKHLELSGEMYGMFKAMLAGLILKLGVFVCLGWYFLRRGDLFYRLLNREAGKED
jgi:hypothetical protein